MVKREDYGAALLGRDAKQPKSHRDRLVQKLQRQRTALAVALAALASLLVYLAAVILPRCGVSIAAAWPATTHNRASGCNNEEPLRKLLLVKEASSTSTVLVPGSAGNTPATLKQRASSSKQVLPTYQVLLKEPVLLKEQAISAEQFSQLMGQAPSSDQEKVQADTFAAEVSPEEPSAPRSKYLVGGLPAGEEEGALQLPEMPDLGRKTVVSSGDESSPSKEKVSELLDAEIEYSDRVARAMEQALDQQPRLAEVRANAAIFSLCRNLDKLEIVKAIQHIDWSFNKRYRYPYVLVNDEPFDDDFRSSVQSATEAEVQFGVVPREHWSLPTFISEAEFNSSLEYNKDRYFKGGSRTYRLMCRYYSMYFYRHPLMLKYRYYMRMEPETDHGCEMRYDPFLFMALYNKKYAYAIVGEELMETVSGIWKVTRDFMTDSNLPMTHLMDTLFNQEWGGYNGIHFWNNFEVVDLDFLRSKEYSNYVEALERSRGFFLQRYGDAPVRTLAVAMLLKPNDTHYMVDIGYKHQWYKTCPVWPGTFPPTTCTCERDGDWSEGGRDPVIWVRSLFRLLCTINVWRGG